MSGRVDRRWKAYCWRQRDMGDLLFALVVRSMVISTANLAVSSYPSPPDIFV